MLRQFSRFVFRRNASVIAGRRAVPLSFPVSVCGCFPQGLFFFPALCESFIHFHGCQIVGLVAQAAVFGGTLYPQNRHQAFVFGLLQRGEELHFLLQRGDRGYGSVGRSGYKANAGGEHEQCAGCEK